MRRKHAAHQKKVNLKSSVQRDRVVEAAVLAAKARLTQPDVLDFKK